jgi:hypothetical protein
MTSLSSIKGELRHRDHADELSRAQLDQLTLLLIPACTGVPRRDVTQLRHAARYTRVFNGSDLTAWLIENKYAHDVGVAVIIGCALISAGVVVDRAAPTNTSELV